MRSTVLALYHSLWLVLTRNFKQKNDQESSTNLLIKNAREPKSFKWDSEFWTFDQFYDVSQFFDSWEDITFFHELFKRVSRAESAALFVGSWQCPRHVITIVVMTIQPAQLFDRCSPRFILTGFAAFWCFYFLNVWGIVHNNLCDTFTLIRWRI